jgi:8-oxo-dGTP diphosphatase
MKPGIDYTGISTPFYCIDEEGRLLMHKRTKACRDEHDRWDTGSGKLEHELSLAENVLKEVEEEYGCKGTIMEQLPAHDIFREQNEIKTHWLAVPLFIKIRHDEAKNNEPEKIGEMGWFTLSTLPEPLHTGFAQTLKQYRSYFEKYIKA